MISISPEGYTLLRPVGLSPADVYPVGVSFEGGKIPWGVPRGGRVLIVEVKQGTMC